MRESERERETECSSRFLSQQIRSARRLEAPPAKCRIPLLHLTLPDVYLSVSFACMRAHGHTHTHTIIESHHHFPLWSGCVTTSSAWCRLISNCKASLIFYLGSRVTVGLRCLQPPACSATRESATCLSDAKRGEPRQNGTLLV